jgi:small subunit ribosomal protein S1
MTDELLTRKILILAANPKGTNQILLDEEIRNIEEGLRQSRDRDIFIIESKLAVRSKDIRRAIMNSNPQIVHFSGHGDINGGLAFENETGELHLVNPDALAELFRLFSNQVKCVLLNACYSEIQANAIVQHIDFVIGMNKEIGDRAAIEFSIGFYDALGNGRSIENAYEFGCNAIQMAGISENLTPVIKRKNDFLPSAISSFSQFPIKDLKSRTATLVRTKVTYEFVITGNIDEINKQRIEAIVNHLREITGDTSLTLLKIEEGSIKLLLEGSEEGFKVLESLLTAGELNQVLGRSVQRVRQVTERRTSADIGFTLDDFAALLDEYDYHFSPGDIVAGTVFSLEPKGALIDIGAKTAAYLPIQEMSINRVDALEEVLQSGETREFFILTDENEDGQLTLSIRRIEYMRAWERVRQLQAEDATVRSQVLATNRGGALVRIEGLRGFIPGSHIGSHKPKEELLNEELPLKFLEVDEERNRLVLSHRRALVGRKMNRLEVGEVVIGSVRSIKPYGAFIDIGGVSGLLHISEISHERIDTPHTVFSVNDEVKVIIIDLDAERGRISLSTKQLEPEPGDMIKDRDRVYAMAEETAQKYREVMAAKATRSSIDSPEELDEYVEILDEDFVLVSED